MLKNITIDGTVTLKFQVTEKGTENSILPHNKMLSNFKEIILEALSDDFDDITIENIELGELVIEDIK